MYSTIKGFWSPHRIILLCIAVAIVVLCAINMRWDWVLDSTPLIAEGVWRTLLLLFFSVLFGFILAVFIGLSQVSGPKPLAMVAKVYCSIIRGTPLLLQIWLLYYGLGSVFSANPEIRQSFMWSYLREAWPYALLALTMSFAAYEGEVMRGAFLGVPKGELEAAKSYGMNSRQVFRRIWLPRAIHRALPTLGGEVILQLKSTPLIATITIVDVFGAISKVRQDTYLTYEPLLLLALIYMIIAGLLALLFRYLENKSPA